MRFFNIRVDFLSHVCWQRLRPSIPILLCSLALIIALCFPCWFRVRIPCRSRLIQCIMMLYVVCSGPIRFSPPLTKKSLFALLLDLIAPPDIPCLSTAKAPATSPPLVHVQTWYSLFRFAGAAAPAIGEQLTTYRRVGVLVFFIFFASAVPCLCSKGRRSRTSVVWHGGVGGAGVTTALCSDL